MAGSLLTGAELSAQQTEKGWGFWKLPGGGKSAGVTEQGVKKPDAPWGPQGKSQGIPGTSMLCVQPGFAGPASVTLPASSSPVSIGSDTHAFCEGFPGLCAGFCSTLWQENPVRWGLVVCKGQQGAD